MAPRIQMRTSQRCTAFQSPPHPHGQAVIAPSSQIHRRRRRRRQRRVLPPVPAVGKKFRGLGGKTMKMPAGSPALANEAPPPPKTPSRPTSDRRGQRRPSESRRKR